MAEWNSHTPVELSMSSLYEALYKQIVAIDRNMALPAVHSFTFPPLPRAGSRQNNFAYLSLTDGSIGLTYVALDDALQDLHGGDAILPVAGQSPAELAGLYRNTHGWERALGLSAINAISQHVLSRFTCLDEMPENVQLLSPEPDERIGMVGYFGRVVEPLRAKGISLTVIELEESLLTTIDEVADEIRLACPELAYPQARQVRLGQGNSDRKWPNHARRVR